MGRPSRGHHLLVRAAALRRHLLSSADFTWHSRSEVVRNACTGSWPRLARLGGFGLTSVPVDAVALRDRSSASGEH